MNSRGKLGKTGEDEICKYLVDNGHTILERNWRAGRLEIDIISLAADGMHFVEVKSRTAPVQGEPEDAVNRQKQRHIANAARKYMALKDDSSGNNLEIWFDIASVIFDKGETRIHYFPGAFFPVYV